ncbi:uncharacterized protein LOC130732101 [Lotus japonicus]|uniref:uncharacterized protein LOC130732101 n=1 Tax=Lotus japonicus TaxID=34305 RepID=UPI002583BB39|nr:uncharacterized protein LOC130732101 [Lotus japonicus]
MAKNLRRPSSKDKDIVGRFNLNGCCKKHPKHRQAPGVCSLCLKDKLYQLSSPASSSSHQRAAHSDSSCSSSLSSSSSSSSVSSCASPHRPMHHHAPVSIFLFSGKQGGGLVKSRSMAVFPTTRLRETRMEEKKSDKKNGFWFKLLHPKKSKRIMEEKNHAKMVRASSLRETLTVRT